MRNKPVICRNQTRVNWSYFTGFTLIVPLFQPQTKYICLLPLLLSFPMPPLPLSSYKVSVKDPVGVEVMDAIQDLVEQRLDHSSRQLKWLFVGLGCSVELNNVLQRDKIPVSLVCAQKRTESITLCAFAHAYIQRCMFMLQAGWVKLMFAACVSISSGEEWHCYSIMAFRFCSPHPSN